MQPFVLQWSVSKLFIASASYHHLVLTDLRGKISHTTEVPPRSLTLPRISLYLLKSSCLLTLPMSFPPAPMQTLGTTPFPTRTLPSIFPISPIPIPYSSYLWHRKPYQSTWTGCHPQPRSYLKTGKAHLFFHPRICPPEQQSHSWSQGRKSLTFYVPSPYFLLPSKLPASGAVGLELLGSLYPQQFLKLSIFLMESMERWLLVCQC